MPKISVIVPIYNVEKYLSQCLDSLIHQTLQDIEIICVNDGSTDDSLTILQDYAKRDVRIKVIDKTNTGYGNSMNQGLANATGEYIGIIESDDFADLNMFTRLYETAELYSVDIVKSNHYDYSDKYNVESKFIEALNGLKYDYIFVPGEEMKIFYVMPSVWSGIYRRGFLNENKISFNETPGASYQDVAFTVKVFATAKSCVLVKDAFIHYRRDNEYSSVHSKNKVFCICDEFKEIKCFLEKNSKLYNNFKFMIENLKYQKYMWNYNRLGSEHQASFVMKMAEEFRDDDSKNLLNEKYWSLEEWLAVHRLMKNTKQFFYARMLYQQKNKMYLHAFLQILAGEKKIIIYGAGIIGRIVAEYLKNKKYKVLSFAVSSLEGNPQAIFEIPVYSIKELQSYKENSMVLISTKEEDQIGIFESLRQVGFTKVMFIDSQLVQLLT